MCARSGPSSRSSTLSAISSPQRRGETQHRRRVATIGIQRRELVVVSMAPMLLGPLSDGRLLNKLDHILNADFCVYSEFAFLCNRAP